MQPRSPQASPRPACRIDRRRFRSHRCLARDAGGRLDKEESTRGPNVRCRPLRAAAAMRPIRSNRVGATAARNRTLIGFPPRRGTSGHGCDGSLGVHLVPETIRDGPGASRRYGARDPQSGSLDSTSRQWTLAFGEGLWRELQLACEASGCTERAPGHAMIRPELDSRSLGSSRVGIAAGHQMTQAFDGKVRGLTVVARAYSCSESLAADSVPLPARRSRRAGQNGRSPS
jgi:hypothetical protein